MQKSKLLLEPKQETNFKEKKEKIKSTISQKQNWKQIFYKIQENLETWKLLTKYKLQYFPKILGAEKPIKGHKHQGEKRELHRVFLVYFLLCNSFVLPLHGRLNLFG